MADLTLYVADFSTNCERVAIALGHKGLTAQRVVIRYEDRQPVIDVSGQGLVPVLIDGATTLADSSKIIEYLEATYPDPPLFPADPARRAETELFVDWFNRAWKREPNLVTDALGHDEPATERWTGRIQRRQDLFERLLTGRDFLLGDQLSAADCTAWPFLRFAAGRPDGDDEDFHVVCEETQRTDATRHPNLMAWIQRVAELPRG